MRAVLCTAFGPPDEVTLGKVAVPTVGDDEVLIRVAYCGVNFPDVLIVQGKYQFRPEFPFSPGGEVSGVVVEAGKQVHHVQSGDYVLAAMGWGGFAEYAVAQGSNTYLLPSSVSKREASALLETYATALYGLKDRALLKTGETLVVMGAAGGTGTAAIQLSKLFGAKVIAVVSTEEKRAFARANGAGEAFSPEEAKASIKAMGGADVIFDPVGGTLTEDLFRTLNPGGRHLVVGFASGEVPSLPLNLPLLKSASVVGVFWGHFWRNECEANRRNVHLLLKWLAAEKIKPHITKTYDLKNASHALMDLMERKVRGKIILEVED